MCVYITSVTSNTVVLWWKLWDSFQNSPSNICISSARHFITWMWVFFVVCFFGVGGGGSSRCSSGYHQRDLCKLIPAVESPQLNKHIWIRSGPRLLLELNGVWSPLLCRSKSQHKVTNVSLRFKAFKLKNNLSFVHVQFLHFETTNSPALVSSPCACCFTGSGELSPKRGCLSALKHLIRNLWHSARRLQ